MHGAERDAGSKPGDRVVTTGCRSEMGGCTAVCACACPCPCLTLLSLSCLITCVCMYGSCRRSSLPLGAKRPVRWLMREVGMAGAAVVARLKLTRISFAPPLGLAWPGACPRQELIAIAFGVRLAICLDILVGSDSRLIAYLNTSCVHWLEANIPFSALSLLPRLPTPLFLAA
ncbi:hypothetical protein B0J12DRAFT_681004 [Macrophomina phaseolina]|uniref:Uncharacterized protein n=1 Tax=Macrophomina phaseolina TaxID=35725 RepID=A0ABQ8FZB8_9PEZI|nr:hypothetical protein B0J12DRAFT_681004 [Macrophomina phaseolina]